MIDSVSTPHAPQPVGAYSQAIAAAAVVFTAGMGPLDPLTGEVTGADVTAQTDAVLDNLAAVLAVRGLTLRDVVKATVHLQYLQRDFAAFDAAYRARMSAPYPARTTVGSDLNGILVEIDFVAIAAE